MESLFWGVAERRGGGSPLESECILRFGVDTGGTFTDLIVEADDGALMLAKAPTTPDDPVQGVLDVLNVAADRRGQTLRAMLAQGELLIHGTTHAINAVVTGKTAKTALLVTQGHEDILTFREGGRAALYDYGTPTPRPYVPRRLTFGVPERIYADGRVLKPLDEQKLDAIIARLTALEVEAVAVCLLWSVVNPDHELAVKARVEAALPGVPVTVSHQLNPTIREYRRASATAIDASLKPLMTHYLGSLDQRLRAEGFAGRLLVVTSGGGVLDASVLSEKPIHSIGSGPAMAPVAARFYAVRDADTDTAIVGDVGGTTFDVALIRRGRIGRTREKWIGRARVGHMTGFHSVDITSVAIGGGSIASVDAGGLLHVGPESAGASPGPACFGKGGTKPTVTDANLALGRIDPDYFLDGQMKLDVEAARAAIDAHVAKPLGLGVDDAADAILNLATEHIVLAVEDVTVNQGADPAEAAYVAAGGGGGFNAVSIGKRLGCRKVIVPESVATLSAAGALMSELTADFSIVQHASSDAFDVAAINRALEALKLRADAFIAQAKGLTTSSRVEFSFEARYASQLWEIETPLPVEQLPEQDGLAMLRKLFEDLHCELYTFADERSPLTFTQWNARAICSVRTAPLSRAAPAGEGKPAKRKVRMPGQGWADTPIWRLDQIAASQAIEGPAIIESPLTTIVIDSGARAQRNQFGAVVVDVKERV